MFEKRLFFRFSNSLRKDEPGKINWLHAGKVVSAQVVRLLHQRSQSEREKEVRTGSEQPSGIYDNKGATRDQGDSLGIDQIKWERS